MLYVALLLTAVIAGYILGSHRERSRMEAERKIQEEKENEETKAVLPEIVIPKNLESVTPKETEQEPIQEEKQEPDENTETMEDEVIEILEKMTLEEKISQMFFITPEALTGAETVTVAGEVTRKAIEAYPVGGICYFRNNIVSEEQFVGMVEGIQNYSMERTGLPLFIGVDEEGGTVSRISGRGFVEVPEIPSMLSIGESGDPQKAYEVGNEIGSYLKRFQMNVDFAPVADVFTNPANTVIGDRAFGKEAQVAASMVEQEVKGLNEQGIAAALKHFPGHGDTAQDSHKGIAYTNKTLDEMRACELIPFQKGIESGAQFVMIGHIACPKITGSDIPATLSEQIVTDILREKMGYTGIVITDGMNMGAIVNNYRSQEAAVMAVQAGVDMILMPGDFHGAWNGILQAVKEGRITEERIDESVRRIIELKKNL